MLYLFSPTSSAGNNVVDISLPATSMQYIRLDISNNDVQSAPYLAESRSTRTNRHGRALPATPGSAQPGPAVAAGCAGILPGGRLNAVAALSQSNAWAVGNYSGATVKQTLIEHWDGTA